MPGDTGKTKRRVMVQLFQRREQVLVSHTRTHNLGQNGHFRESGKNANRFVIIVYLIGRTI